MEAAKFTVGVAGVLAAAIRMVEQPPMLGDLDFARARLAEAIRLAPECRAVALTDPDLVTLRTGLDA